MPRLAIALALCAAFSAARADEGNADAKQHYLSGAAAYDHGDYQVALGEFQKSWELEHTPAMLFNLARASAKLGHDDQALAYLHQYLDGNPDEADVPAIRAEIEAREKAIAERHARAAAEAAVVAAAQEQKVEADRSRRSERRRRWVAGWTLFGLGLAVAAAGAGVGALAIDDAKTVQDGGASRPGAAPVPFRGSFADSAAEGNTAAHAGLALDVVGGVMAVAGVSLIVLGAKF